ncbi:MAG TPA: hypothetical protein VMB71_15410 [Acetobacteraceae bacterium]|nr:hypothetical protein [Acetobacteraceae bacterium]
MSHSALVDGMLADIAAAADVRRQYSTGEAAAARHDLRRWQAARLAKTHADLLASPRYAKAASFFLTDLYGPDGNISRYEQAERVMPIAIRVLPQAGLEILADAWKLDALTETLDAAMMDALGGGVHTLTAEGYAAAYRRVGRGAERARQIDLIGVLAYALQRLAANRYAATALALMRGPARVAGVGDLQDFLARGLAALQCLGDVASFVETVTTRERSLMTSLLAGDSVLLGLSPG